MIENKMKKQIISEFRKNPDVLIEDLSSQMLLRGNVLKIIQDYIKEHPNRPWSQKYEGLLYLPKRISLYSVADFCNLSCRMCGGSKGKLKYIKAEQLETIINHIPSVELLTFVSGNSEPLLNPDFVDILDIVNKRKINVQIVSNTHFLTEKVVNKLVLLDSCVDYNVSLDAVSEEMYKEVRGASIEPVIKNLEYLKEQRDKYKNNNIDLSLLMVGMSDNIEELPKMVKLAKSLNAYRIKVDHMTGVAEPGDFEKNPNWQSILINAFTIANELEIVLNVPNDTWRKIVEYLGTEKTETNNDDKKVEKTDNIVEGVCPWLETINIYTDGKIVPCCHIANDLGNIFNEDLFFNDKYINAKINLSKGKVFKACIPQNRSNCNYAVQLKGLENTEDYFIEEN